MARSDSNVDSNTPDLQQEDLTASDAYHVLFERSADANLIIEGETFIDCNQATVEMLKYSTKEELLRTHPSELSPPRQPDGRKSYEKANEMIAIAIAEGSHRFEWTHRRADGDVFPVEVLLTSITIHNRQSVHVVWRDITERKLLEDQLRHAQKMEAIGQLAGGIAHDFNNLLVAIVGNSELIEMRLSDESTEKEMAAQIRRAGERAATLVRQLLAFSRKQEMQPRVLDLDVLIHDARHLLVRLIGEDIELMMVPANQPLRIKADPTQLEQVLLNLASNARDAMPRGGLLTIKTSQHEIEGSRQSLPAGAYARLIVTDEGEGMSPETVRCAFDPFYTTKAPGKGTGLGLSMIYGAIRQSGGEVTLESTLGDGTSVVITLPLTTDEIATSDDGHTIESSQGGDETILIAEDEVAVSTLMVRVLREQGYQVLLANNGRKALELFLAHHEEIDLVISDVVMPELGGPELLEELRAAGHSPLVLFTSGYSDSQLTSLRRLEHKFDILDKPYSVRDLVHRVRQTLDFSN